jgi:protein SCO1/2
MSLLPEARPLEPFRLAGPENKSFTNEQLKGHWSVLFFGYTHCPDICPTTLSTLRGVADRLQQGPADYADTQFVFISVDPQRDSLDHLREYVRYFHPDFIAATGEKAQLDNLVRQLRAVYMFDGDTTGEDYVVNHSASIAVVDPQGRWVARFNPPHQAARMAEQFRRLRDFYQPQPTPAG